MMLPVGRAVGLREGAPDAAGRANGAESRGAGGTDGGRGANRARGMGAWNARRTAAGVNRRTAAGVNWRTAPAGVNPCRTAARAKRGKDGAGGRRATIGPPVVAQTSGWLERVPKARARTPSAYPR